MNRERGWDIALDSTWMTAVNEDAENAFRMRVLRKNPALSADPVALEEKVVEQSTKSKQVCLSEKTSREKILDQVRDDMHWHPLTHLPLQQIPYDTRNYVQKVWGSQVQRMHQLCKDLGESWAWEYLWKNWYAI
jgi:hypothetical protein